MRLVIRSRRGAAAGGMGRYHGSGFFRSLARKLFSAGVKKVINVASKADLQQKLADVVVNGAKSAGQSLGKRAGVKLGSIARKKIVNTIAQKRPRPATAAAAAATRRRRPPPPPHNNNNNNAAKRRRLDSFINHRGSGIIL